MADGPGWGQVASNRAIALGQVSLSFYAVTGAVVHEVLERLGHSVVVREGPHEQMFPLLGQGAIDLMAAAWLPEGHKAYWDSMVRAPKRSLNSTMMPGSFGVFPTTFRLTKSCP
jgi:ABC-type proline/glycine betaine transport system substrate-binding protein